MNRQQKKAQKDAERREKVRKAKIAEDWQRRVDELVYAMVNREQTGGIMLLLDDEESLREGYMIAEACVLAAERLKVEVIVRSVVNPEFEEREAMWDDIETFALYLKTYRHLEARFGFERINRVMPSFAGHAKVASEHVLATGVMPPLKSWKSRAA